MVLGLQILAAAVETTKNMTSTSNSSTIYSNVKVPLFEGENYDFWTVKMETLFTSLDVLEFIQHGYEEPVPIEAEKSNEKAGESSQRLEELKKKKKITDVGVLRMIQRGVSIHFSMDYESKNIKGSMEYSTIRV